MTIGGVSFKVTAIESNAFKNFTKAKKVTIGKYITEIGTAAFSGCKALKTVGGCSSVEKIGRNAFYKCGKLKTVGSVTGKLTLPKIRLIDNSAFRGCKSIQMIYHSSGSLTSIKDNAFQECKGLRTVSISSKKLSVIGKSAFKDCARLNTVILKTKKLNNKKVGENVFKGIKSTCAFKVPSEKINSYKKLFRAKGAGSKLIVKKG